MAITLQRGQARDLTHIWVINFGLECNLRGRRGDECVRSWDSSSKKDLTHRWLGIKGDGCIKQVKMQKWGQTTYLRRLEGIICWEVDVHEEYAAAVGRIILNTKHLSQFYYSQHVPANTTQCGNIGGQRRPNLTDLEFERTGPMIVAAQWKRSSPSGPKKSKNAKN